MLVASCAIVAIAAALVAFGASAQSTIVDTGYAKYQGNHSLPNTVAYLGIPYAEPPIGDLRFRAPLALNTTRVAQSTRGLTVNASAYPNFCVQGTTGSGDAGGAGSEDCLKINIYTPFGARKGSNLPVLVYIHGGGYIYGNPANWPFDHWIAQSPNVVIISVYYRLDSLGFLAHPSFVSSPSLGDSNAGFLDQIQALKWIQKYISNFGGDPGKVTINGESAGGSSVELHLVANEGGNLFVGAIAQSVYRTPVPFLEQKTLLFDYYATQAGCGVGGVEVQMACLRKASVSALARAQDAAYYNTNISYRQFTPVQDGKLLTDYPTKLILEGKSRTVPIIVGSTSNESLSSGTSIPSALQAFFPSLSNSSISAFLSVYSLSEFDSPGQQFQVATGESELICARAGIGSAYAKRTTAWTYRYNQPNPTSGSTAVGHAAENWMMFDGTNTGFNGSTTFTPQNPVQQAFAAELIAYWLSFVRTGDPNTYKLAKSPTWSQYTTDQKARIVLQQDPQNVTTASGSYLENEPTVESERCQFVVGQVEGEQN